MASDPRASLCKAPLFYGKELEGFSQGEYTVFVTDIRYLLENENLVTSAAWLAHSCLPSNVRYLHPYQWLHRLYLGAGELSDISISDLHDLLTSEYIAVVKTLVVEATAEWYLANAAELKHLVQEFNCSSANRSAARSRYRTTTKLQFEFVVTTTMIGSGGRFITDCTEKEYVAVKHLQDSFEACNVSFYYKVDACNVVVISIRNSLAGNTAVRLSSVGGKYSNDVDLTPYIDDMKR
jgi:hypothetical protein